MFTPSDIDKIYSWNANDLKLLPCVEDELHEYKSSKIDITSLPDKIGKAASAFWNSGGGLFVIGVDDNGNPNGGISTMRGSTPIKDWIDQILLSKVEPQAIYKVHTIDISTDGKAIILVAFAPSEIGPHMASDKKYYIRAGSLSVPASHFIVESIRARRSLKYPILRHVLRWINGPELGVICLNDAPAFDVHIGLCNFKNLKINCFYDKQYIVPVISKDNPFIFSYRHQPLGQKNDISFDLNIKYSDFAGSEHVIDLNVDEQIQMCEMSNNNMDLIFGLSKIAQALSGIEHYMSEIRTNRK